MKATVLSRPECYLCHDAVESLNRIQAEFPALEIEEIDIETDDDLLREYLERIPVILLDGEIVSELVLDAGFVRTRLINT